MPPLAWTDTHCHLGEDLFDADRREAIERARAEGVHRIVVVGETIQAARRALEVATAREGLYAVVGLHPHHGDRWDERAAEEVARLADEGADKVVAIGETGLDFYYENSSPEGQRRAFLAQAELARALKKPLVLHCRDAYEECIETIARHKMDEIGGVVHCYSGNVDQAHRLVDMGFYLGITGVLTFKKADLLRQVVRAVPVDRLVIETDAPYLAPVPRRGKRNEPAWVAHTARRLAEELGMTPGELSPILERNTDRLYRIQADALA